MRQNKHDVSYSDYVAVLGDYGYDVQSAKGSHRKAKLNIGEDSWKLVFVEPHGNKKSVHIDAVKKLLKQIAEIEALKKGDDNE